MYAFIDLETSGGKFNKEKIIEIAIIIYNGKKIIESYSTLVNPSIKVDFYVQKLTGIKNPLELIKYSASDSFLN